ncbi:hypothetical protein HHI36_020106 [Cryptolaemus montrouzieri]|uniref:Uncharacterized protein n=1 Tax=Cryptolaemus montrouzieri TaxID=559131 RepID=A0ABD2N9Y2_9CUCU
MSGQHTTNKISTLISGNVIITDNQSIAEAFGKYFQQKTESPMNNQITKLLSKDTGGLNMPFILNELKYALSSTKYASSTGTDDIPSAFLKYLFSDSFDRLIELFNKV